jgi:predicted nucleic-acid-binding protein
MIALDTNIVVRLIVDDDPDQVGRSRAVIERNGASVGPSVLLEAAWVLARSYRLTPQTIALAFNVMAAAEGMSLPAWAGSLRECVDAGIDIGDAIHLFETNPEFTFVTFDRNLALRAQRSFDRPKVATP